MTHDVLMVGRGHIIHTVKMHYFVKNFFSTLGHYSEKIKCIVMMTMKVSTKNVSFMTPGQGFL